MGIVQATCTMTDGVVAFWILCAACEVLALRSEEPVLPSIIFANLAAGLALLTKPTAAVYLLPLAGLAAFFLIRRTRPLQLLRWAGLSLALVLILNAGHLLRNTITYGNPISDQARIAKQSNGLKTIPGMLSNVLRNAALHLGTPEDSVNVWIFAHIAAIHDWMDVDINDPRTTLHGKYGPLNGFVTHEDLVGNLFHAVLIALTFCVVLAGGKRLGWLAVVYMLLLVAGFFLFSFLFKWQIFGARYHLPFFVLFAPLVSYAAVRFLPANVARLLGVALILGSSLWLFSINSRPLISIPGRSYVNSILVTPREELYFANGQPLLPSYVALTEQVKAANCSTVGIMLSGSAAEYPFWVLLGAPRRGLEIEWLVAGNLSARYEKPDFDPCAVICQGCPQDWDMVRDLPRVYDDDTFQLFLAPTP